MPRYCLSLTGLSWTSTVASCPRENRDCTLGWFYSQNEICFFIFSLLIFIPKHTAVFSSKPGLSAPLLLVLTSHPGHTSVPQLPSSSWGKSQPKVAWYSHLVHFHVSVCVYKERFLFLPPPWMFLRKDNADGVAVGSPHHAPWPWHCPGIAACSSTQKGSERVFSIANPSLSSIFVF